MALTIGETTDALHHALRDYIEATYHVGHPSLVAQRRALLEQAGVIHQRPFIESTPRYQSGERFEKLGLDDAALEVFEALSSRSGDLGLLIHNPPYQHQARAVQLALVEGKSLVVMTGTGSGKTECFLLPILGKLASEAKRVRSSFATTAAVRALVLYPMNALVNDQLGRLRLLFGDPRVVDRFEEWAGRPARFARYTSRTLYPGVRSSAKDQDRLAPLGQYYVENLRAAMDPSSPRHEAAAALVSSLRVRGKWPAKPDLIKWYGDKGARWKDARTDTFKRCVTLPGDPELLTRHEVHASPPDVLVTNYSMLEYMLMRPLERPIFDRTRDWLRDNPEERFLLVIDEAHLYRGAAGAEVALLMRRLRVRLGIPPERLQVICTSASFSDPDGALHFGAQLTGKNVSDFEIVEGELALRAGAASGSHQDAEVLSSLDLEGFYAAESDAARLKYVAPFLRYRGVAAPWELQTSLYHALEDFGPLSQLVNITMKQAQPADGLGRLIFDTVPEPTSAQAINALIALSTIARRDPTEPGLLPCRVHSFYRGLAGLWVCMDPQCTCLPVELRGGPTGKLFAQPRDRCDCGARVLELYTCRNCGTAYGRAYTDRIEDPGFLWSESGGAFRTLAGSFQPLEPLDLLLEEALISESCVPAEYDLVTGRLNPTKLGDRNRQIYIRGARVASLEPDEDARETASPGEFRPCAVCGERAAFGRSSVQDHQTKGDQPFQALIAKQVQLQPPGAVPATRLAPLRGRKVLIFSDSRQTAARLAPNLQTYSTQDALRPLIVAGFAHLSKSPEISRRLTLDDLYLGVLIAAKVLGVRLRPELLAGESFQHDGIVDEALQLGTLADPDTLLSLMLDLRASHPPSSLLRAIVSSLGNRYYGLEALALASLAERHQRTVDLESLPTIPGVAEAPGERLALARAWIRCWARAGLWLKQMPPSWWGTNPPPSSMLSSHFFQPRSGKFKEMNLLLQNSSSRQIFEKQWLPKLLKIFGESLAPGKYRLNGGELTLAIGGSWAYCRSCRTTQRPFPNRQVCINCGRNTASVVDPDADPVFVARKQYYRASTVDALKSPGIPPLALIAAEHTAQLNTAQAEQVFSTAEEHELLFQDVNLGPDESQRERPAIDVLSCTTTMEVGIDIGALSGVSLRNMPPARANYQQRAGRAGRRGNALATVTAFGSADSHDEHYFTHPDLMVSGKVDDPTLTLDNPEIVRRHVTAYLLQRYHQAKLPSIRPEEQPQLFAVLGTVSGFKNPEKILNREDLEKWLTIEASDLKAEVDSWLPEELEEADRRRILDNLIDDTLRQIDNAIGQVGVQEAENQVDEDPLEPPDSGPEGVEAPPESGEERSGKDPNAENLLDRLLYHAVLPRYAFPTDVAAFHVFDQERSTHFRPAFRYTPSQGLPVALSQYAPGKEVWIANKLWTSGAIYSPIRSDRYRAWQSRRLYFECENCHYARTDDLSKGHRGERLDCPACGSSGSFGPATFWIRPPGFAHPVGKAEGTSPDDQPAKSYATRAKLTAPTPADENHWTRLNDRLRVHFTRQHLLVTNRGPLEEGYTYCTKCGLIEPTAIPNGIVSATHRKPFPDPQNPDCPGGAATRGLVLGTDFKSDVLLISLRVQRPLTLLPQLRATDVALRTVSEALTKAACNRLELEPAELQAEYRPALTAFGRDGYEAEIYLYDTLPGGAGFSQRVGQLGIGVFRDALRILEDCPEDCDRSCYRCLRSYKNKFEHDLLDRQIGASLLRYLVDGAYPALSESRLAASTNALYQDLLRQGLEGITFERDKALVIPGLGEIRAPIFAKRSDGAEYVIGLHGPLTPGEPADQALHDFKEFSPTIVVLLRDEMVVSRNLPAETSRIISRIGGKT